VEGFGRQFAAVILNHGAGAAQVAVETVGDQADEVIRRMGPGCQGPDPGPQAGMGRGGCGTGVLGSLIGR